MGRGGALGSWGVVLLAGRVKAKGRPVRSLRCWNRSGGHRWRCVQPKRTPSRRRHRGCEQEVRGTQRWQAGGWHKRLVPRRCPEGRLGQAKAAQQEGKPFGRDSVLRTQVKICPREQQWRKTAVGVPGAEERRCKVYTRALDRRWRRFINPLTCRTQKAKPIWGCS